MTEEKYILITAELEIGTGLGYDGMTLFHVPVEADISEKGFRHKLTSLMDVEWESDVYCHHRQEAERDPLLLSAGNT